LDSCSGKASFGLLLSSGKASFGRIELAKQALDVLSGKASFGRIELAKRALDVLSGKASFRLLKRVSGNSFLAPLTTNQEDYANHILYIQTNLVQKK
jgi:hypothetical protein